MPELKLGYKASAEQFGPRELVELGVAAKAHGMDSAVVSDHLSITDSALLRCGCRPAHP
jgi:alkanesulfonate monooxygenase SsuD/methylene tetrahydromethanopterin reductase-like flavin-dependent oxidoreductase (luciferase family)